MVGSIVIETAASCISAGMYETNCAIPRPTPPVGTTVSTYTLRTYVLLPQSHPTTRIELNSSTPLVWDMITSYGIHVMPNTGVSGCLLRESIDIVTVPAGMSPIPAHVSEIRTEEVIAWEVKGVRTEVHSSEVGAYSVQYRR